MRMIIRETTERDRETIYRVEALAFGHEKEAKLVDSLLDDPTARPHLSLLALEDVRAVGHILFTAGDIVGSSRKVSLLAPLSVAPEAQGRGVGGRLIQAGLARLAEAAVDLVFVLGHPSYYPRHGFVPAHTYGLEAPYPIPEEHLDAWMVQGLHPSALENVRGKVVCAAALDRPEHWRE
ncbi:N-acetyltransferase [Pseudodesulfovibrio indicus]|uniref:GNAT family N-acetyltransferase n=1 Tax=Pseudodesulfovibrio indicus TaxID=1716143 RepID=UPI00292D1963|nr:N-acetyltransferase [Pseudodesulfovibrio indicus]